MSETMRKILYYENILEFKENTQTPLNLSDVKNWQLCRTCLESTETLVDFEGVCVIQDGGNILTVQNMLAETTDVKKISPRDGLPTKICKDCLNKLSTLFFFKQQTKRAENVLKLLLGKLNETAPTVEEAATEMQIEEISAKNEDIECTITNNSNEIDADNSETRNDEEVIAENKEVHEDIMVVELKQESVLLENVELEKESVTCYNIEAINTTTAHLSNEEAELAEEYYLDEDNENVVVEINDDNVDNDDNNDITIELEDENTSLLSIEHKLNASNENIKPEKQSRANECAMESSSKRNKPRLNKSLLENFNCIKCDAEFQLQRELVEHVHYKHPNSKAFKCRECNGMFSHMQSLSRHMQSHKVMQCKYICDLCGKSFLRADDWKRHMRVHSGERPYSCSLCTKAFKQLNELKEHQITHVKSKLYKCDICGTRLSSRNGIYVHKKAHAGIKNCVCQQCGKRFLTNGELKSHLNMHARKARTED